MCMFICMCMLICMYMFICVLLVYKRRYIHVVDVPRTCVRDSRVIGFRLNPKPYACTYLVQETHVHDHTMGSVML
jgi:hypothetical protein